MKMSTSSMTCARAFPGLIVSALLTAACGGSAPAPAAQPAVPEPPTIDVVPVVRQPLDVPLSLPGELTAFQSVALHPRVTGFVRTVAVDRGTRVRAGSVLLTLDAPELVAQRAEAQARVLGAEAQLSAARARAAADTSTYRRLEAAAVTPGVVAGNDLTVAEQAAAASASQVTAAEQSVEAARQALGAVRELEGYLTMTAPFDGVITERAVHPGALVGPSSVAVLQIVEPRRLRLVVPVPEAYTGGLETGAQVPFSVAGYPGQSFVGTIARIAQSVDVATRTMPVELDVANDEGRLAPGTFCQVRWPVRRAEPSLFVPGATIATTTDRTFVIRVRNGKAEWVDVRTGLAAGTLVEVFGPLSAGDQVAARGTDEIKSGDPVRPRPMKPAA
jgi:membrane fusion protein, multidrug efflux system